MSVKTVCPICDADIEAPGDVVEGELLSCPECGTELEVISTDPFTVAEAPQEEEDWGE